jgi:PAP2 superfamily.
MSSPRDNSGRWLRTVLVLAVTLLHFGVYRLVNDFNSVRPASAFHDFSTFGDRKIPYLGWTFIVYYLALPYVIAMGMMVVWRLPSRRSFHAIGAFAFLIVAGGALQLTFPARSPWPAEVTWVQSFFHSISFDPFVCLPSMHVALATLTAALSTAVFPSSRAKLINGSIAVAISISTLTLKEHYLLDVLAGGLFAGVVYLGWRRWPLIAPARPKGEEAVEQE